VHYVSVPTSPDLITTASSLLPVLMMESLSEPPLTLSNTTP